MKYLLMMNVPAGTGEYEHVQWSPADWEAHLDYWRRLNRELAEAGELVEIQALFPPREAKLVRAGRNGAPRTDGPFPESKEFLAGFWVVETDSPERAYAIAAHASAVPGPGGVPMNMPIEVRGVMQTCTPSQDV
ncbi:MAG TPA: YciI family protein [Longimicrobium sp.]|nr:YciI family protein [Longimicrobium sp.]